MAQPIGVFLAVDFAKSLVDDFAAYALCSQADGDFAHTPAGEAVFVAHVGNGESPVVDEAALAQALDNLNGCGGVYRPPAQFVGKLALAMLAPGAQGLKAYDGLFFRYRL